MISPEFLADQFTKRHGQKPAVWAIAPGRVNLIGEHIDYNDGYVLPAAIDRSIGLAANPRNGSICRFFSNEFESEEDFDLAQLEPGAVEGFARYPAGMAWALGSERLTAFDADIHSDLPTASGVSSSAAFEVAAGTLWNHANSLGFSPIDIAKAAQKAENQFVGLKCGIMDMMASAAGKAGCCLLIDTRNLTIKAVKLPPDLMIVVCDTRKPRGLTESAYNERWSQCRQAAEELGVPSLRDATEQMLNEARPRMDPVVWRRASHVISENARTLAMVQALETSDRVGIGRLMAESHASLRNDYEVSCFELDEMVASAKIATGCAGVRMTGAGFGGCCVALVERQEINEFLNETQAEFRRRTGYEPILIVSEAAGGARAGSYSDFVLPAT